MFKVVATIFQQIMIELNGAHSEKDRIMAVTKIVQKLMTIMVTRVHRQRI
jgi:TATA-box binding protein (TBP) (component of TFIID and TFIIIB)